MASPLASLFPSCFRQRATQYQATSQCQSQFISHIINLFLFVLVGDERRWWQISDIFPVMSRLLLRNHDWMAIWWWWESVFTFISPITSFSGLSHQSIFHLILLINFLLLLFFCSKTCFSLSPPGSRWAVDRNKSEKSGNDSNYLIESLKYISRCFTQMKISSLPFQY